MANIKQKGRLFPINSSSFECNRCADRVGAGRVFGEHGSFSYTHSRRSGDLVIRDNRAKGVQARSSFATASTANPD